MVLCHLGHSSNSTLLLSRYDVLARTGQRQHTTRDALRVDHARERKEHVHRPVLASTETGCAGSVSVGTKKFTNGNKMSPLRRRSSIRRPGQGRVDARQCATHCRSCRCHAEVCSPLPCSTSCTASLPFYSKCNVTSMCSMRALCVNCGPLPAADGSGARLRFFDLDASFH